MKAKIRLLASASLAVAAHGPCEAGVVRKLCVYDLLGASGSVFGMAKDYAVESQKLGESLEIKAYTDERVASEDFKTGQCDAVILTGFRARQFNSVSGTLDSLGSATIIKDGKIDMPSSYEVLHKAIAIFAAPQAAKLMTEGAFEVGGVIPLGAAYPVVNDRKLSTVEALAGKRIAAFDHDKAQATMTQRIGAQPISADITNFATKFNNGAVDLIAAPGLAYKPLELYKGIGTKGGINRFPILMLTSQLIIRSDRFGEGFGTKSRKFWLEQYDRAMQIVEQNDASIPKSTWIEMSPENGRKYTLMFRDARLELGKTGVYDKRGLKMLKKIRCGIAPSDLECSTDSEDTWK
ncbi:AdeT [Aquabacterium sp. NJ1]|uniref:putative solute-binding protein n=1 Tax=Aquabacterium sp. NJ1 TaxID=1538295 RepID=UPI00052D7854|nr:putative solute-binding protein [Aquabacterium sp. NJ1]KGM39789.1 AdeT [Aquabacterium sp. NJ1]